MARLSLALAAPLCFALVAFAVHPALDLDLARPFFVPPHGFVGATPAGMALRYAAWALPFVLFAVLAAATGLARAGRVRRAPSPRALAFLALSLALGPGLLVHATLKEVSHRPRPYATVPFGGTADFRPFDRFDGACRHNCSFPSGETAAATWTLAPASLAPPPWRGPALAAALAFTAAVGLGRMAFGAHWASDVCGAMLATLLVTLACRALLRPRLVTPDPAPYAPEHPARRPANP